MLHRLIILFLSLVAAGCTLPQAGPTAEQIERSADPSLDVYLVRISAPIVRVLSRFIASGFPRSYRLQDHTPSIALKPGDVIGITIYETGGTPLFSSGTVGFSSPSTPAGQAIPPPASSRGAGIPAQIIEANGEILIPFVGPVSVIGQTPLQASKTIAAKLQGKTAEPQVIVSLLSDSANTITVGGEVNRAGIIPLTLRGEKLLDVIAQAGGPRYPAYQTDVKVIRHGTVASVPLQRILADPKDNIVLQPNDSIVLARNPKTFVVLGAAPRVAQYDMDAEQVTLAEAIAKAGGPVDTIGNLSAIYLMRSEPTNVARAVIDADRGAVDTNYVRTDETRDLNGPEIRMIYRLDLTRAGGYFFAQNIVLRNKDVVLIANAETTQIQKAMQVLRGFTGAYFDLSRGAVNFYVPQ